MDPNYSEPLVVPAILCSDLVVREAGTGKLTLAGVFSGWQSPFPIQDATVLDHCVLNELCSRDN